jgi:hypothetical protein
MLLERGEIEAQVLVKRQDAGRDDTGGNIAIKARHGRASWNASLHLIGIGRRSQL